MPRVLCSGLVVLWSAGSKACRRISGQDSRGNPLCFFRPTSAAGAPLAPVCNHRAHRSPGAPGTQDSCTLVQGRDGFILPRQGRHVGSCSDADTCSPCARDPGGRRAKRSARVFAACALLGGFERQGGSQQKPCRSGQPSAVNQSSDHRRAPFGPVHESSGRCPSDC